jgi:hypothetical protein
MFTAVALALPLGMSAEEDQTQTITSQTLASQPAGTTYALDLRVGSVYSVSADVASRVRIGTITLADLARKLGVTGPTLEVAMISGGRVATRPAGGVTYAGCNQGMCRCSGSRTSDDCRLLAASNVCQESAAAESSALVCGNQKSEKGCVCWAK